MGREIRVKKHLRDGSSVKAHERTISSKMASSGSKMGGKSLSKNNNNNNIKLKKRNMNKSLQIMKLKKFVDSDKVDLFDWSSYVDASLSFEENKKIVISKLNSRGLLSTPKTKDKINSGKLVNRAIELNNKRNIQSKSLDESKFAKKTFKARDLTKKEFNKWNKSKNQYDIESVDSGGNYIKKQKISKSDRNNVFQDLDDLI